MSDRRFYLVVDGRAVDGAFFTELDAVGRQSGVPDALGAAMTAAQKVISLGARRVDVMSEPWPMPHEGEHHRVYSVGVVS